MFKENVITFFNNAAKHWDDNMHKNAEVIDLILDNALVTSGKNVLDVACGTGIIIPEYLERGVKSVTAIDISPEMIRIAKEKFSRKNVSFICGDIETQHLEQKFDCIIIYNAFPHFPDPEKVIKILTSHLNPGGTLIVAHGISRDRINECHAGPARHVSVSLISAEKLASLFEPELTVTVKISNNEMYQVTGIK